MEILAGFGAQIANLCEKGANDRPKKWEKVCRSLFHDHLGMIMWVEFVGYRGVSSAIEISMWRLHRSWVQIRGSFGSPKSTNFFKVPRAHLTISSRSLVCKKNIFAGKKAYKKNLSWGWWEQDDVKIEACSGQRNSQELYHRAITEDRADLEHRGDARETWRAKTAKKARSENRRMTKTHKTHTGNTRFVDNIHNFCPLSHDRAFFLFWYVMVIFSQKSAWQKSLNG